MAQKFQVNLPDEMIRQIRQETDSIAPDAHINRRIRYILARHFGMDSGRALAMLIGDLPRQGRPVGKSAAT